VVTLGGIHGRITEIQDTTFTIEVASNVQLKVEKSAISADSSKRLQEK
jgi:preprotein translocase subunit YajC